MDEHDDDEDEEEDEDEQGEEIEIAEVEANKEVESCELNDESTTTFGFLLVDEVDTEAVSLFNRFRF